MFYQALFTVLQFTNVLQSRYCIWNILENALFFGPGKLQNLVLFIPGNEE